VRTVKVWPEGADSELQQRFEHTDWSVFATQATLDSHTDIDSYASSVLDFINTSINSVTTQTDHYIPKPEAVDEQRSPPTAVGTRRRFQIW